MVGLVRRIWYLVCRFAETVRTDGLVHALGLLWWRAVRSVRYGQTFLHRSGDLTPRAIGPQYARALPALQRHSPTASPPCSWCEVVLADAWPKRGLLVKTSKPYLMLATTTVRLYPHALQFLAEAIEAPEPPDLIYADDDEESTNGTYQPCFKPSYDDQLHLRLNYLGDVILVARELLERVAAHLDGSVSFDGLCLHLAKEAGCIEHISAILSTRARPLSACALACRVAIERAGRRARVDEAETAALRIVYPQPTGTTTVIIPTTGRRQLLEPCLEAIARYSDPTAVKVLVVDSGTGTRADRDYLQSLQQGGGIRVVKWPGSVFNFAAINNYAVGRTDSDFVLFLNDDTEPLDAAWLSSLVGLAQFSEVGAVGSLLIYPNQTIQHAGVVLGVGGPGGHALSHVPLATRPNQPWALCTRQVSAVTAACMLMRRVVFVELGGFDETFSVAYNDVDLCLRLRDRGYQILFTPESRLIHKESRTRRKRHEPSEERAFLDRWRRAIATGDPFYSPALSLEREDLSLSPTFRFPGAATNVA